MTSTSCFRVNTPDVVHEVIEGEAVIVNLSNGVYYSVDRSGADIWELIEARTPAPAIVDALADRYACSREDIQTGVDHFLSQLQAESLIVPDGDQAIGPSPLTAATPDGYRPRFETPTLQRYTDMEDLLLLDPIHDVDEQGWAPGQKAEA
jgi:coenzyme PQQ synthesis protein D (PqqD)